MPDANGNNCEHCGKKKGFASNDPLQPAGTETMCLNSECYEKRMADLAKTDTDQALEVCGTWEKVNAFRHAQERSRAGPSRLSVEDYEEYPPMSMMEPWEPQYSDPRGLPVGEGWIRPNVRMPGDICDDGVPVRRNDRIYIDEHGEAFGVRRRRNCQVMWDWMRNRGR